jgi:hypothetical protein
MSFVGGLLCATAVAAIAMVAKVKNIDFKFVSPFSKKALGYRRAWAESIKRLPVK